MARRDVAFFERLLAYPETRHLDRDGKPLPMGDMFTNTSVSRQIGAQHLAVNYTRYEPGAEFPQPVHDGSEDALFVVTGAGWLKEGERTTPISAGDVIFVRPGEVHGVAHDEARVSLEDSTPTSSTAVPGEPNRLLQAGLGLLVVPLVGALP